MAAANAAATRHPNAALLESLYKDLTTIDAYTVEDVVLHPAARAVDPSMPDIVGRDAVLAWEKGARRRHERQSADER